MRHTIYILLFVCLHGMLFAQAERSLIRKGNQQFKDGNYDAAVIAYQKAVEQNARNDKAMFNLGNAHYQQQNYEQALQHFDQTAQMSHNANLENKTLYNAGNALMSQEKYAESIPYFQQAL